MLLLDMVLLYEGLPGGQLLEVHVVQLPATAVHFFAPSAFGRKVTRDSDCSASFRLRRRRIFLPNAPIFIVALSTSPTLHVFAVINTATYYIVALSSEGMSILLQPSRPLADASPFS